MKVILTAWTRALSRQFIRYLIRNCRSSEELANEFTRSQIRWLLGEKLIFQELLHPFDNFRRLNHDFFGYGLQLFAAEGI